MEMLGPLLQLLMRKCRTYIKGVNLYVVVLRAGRTEIFKIQSYEECRIDFCGMSHVKWRKKVEMLVPLQLLMGKCRAYVKGVLLHRNSLKHSPRSNETISVTLSPYIFLKMIFHRKLNRGPSL